MNQGAEKPSNQPDFVAVQQAFQAMEAPEEQRSRAVERFLKHHRVHRKFLHRRAPQVALAGFAGILLGIFLWPLVVRQAPVPAQFPESRTAARSFQTDVSTHAGLELSAPRRIELPSMENFSMPPGSPGVLPPRPAGTSSLSLSRLTAINEV